jgi:hypothetical protein
MAGIKQHYVPQLLLKNFSLNGLQKQVAAYRIPSNKFIPVAAIRDQAHENRFYGSDKVEDFLMRLEGEATPIIRAAIEKETLPKRRSREYEILLAFVLAQVSRTRGAAEDANDMTDKLVKRLMKDAPQFDEIIDHVRIVVDHAASETLGMTLENLPLARDLACKLFCNRTNFPFLLSDDPAVKYNQFLEHRKKFGSNTGLATKGLQIFLPIGRRHQIVFFDEEVYKVGGRRLSSHRVALTAESDVRALNLLQAANAEAMLYFDEQMPIEEVKSIVQKAAALTANERTQLCEYQPPSGDLAADGSLLRVFSEDTRISLRLSCVTISPQAKAYKHHGQVVHHRNPGMVQLFKRFHAEVKAGKYKAWEWSRYLDDVEASLPGT